MDAPNVVAKMPVRPPLDSAAKTVALPSRKVEDKNDII
jgi:hypothetical protein